MKIIEDKIALPKLKNVRENALGFGQGKTIGLGGGNPAIKEKIIKIVNKLVIR